MSWRSLGDLVRREMSYLERYVAQELPRTKPALQLSLFSRLEAPGCPRCASTTPGVGGKPLPQASRRLEP